MHKDLYDLTQNTQGAIFTALFALHQKNNQPAPSLHPLLQVQRGYAESPAWFLIQAAEFVPEPLTVAQLRVRDIYASPAIVKALLDMMVVVQWFERTAEEKYFLTAAGQEIVHTLTTRNIEPLTQLEKQLATDVAHLERLLRRIIEAWLADTSRRSWCLTHSRHRAPQDDMPALVKVNHYLADFNAYRDDAHMASWQDHHVTGLIWESFSFLHDQQADSAQTLFTQLAHRGYAPFEFEQGLSHLRQKGWVETTNLERYRVTDLGREMRAQAEQVTDDYFYAAWSVLSDEEQVTLPALLRQLSDECRQWAQLPTDV